MTLLLIDHANRRQDPTNTDPGGWYVELERSPHEHSLGTAVDLRVHSRLAMNRPGSTAVAPLTPVEALALAEVLRDYYALPALRNGWGG